MRRNRLIKRKNGKGSFIKEPVLLGRSPLFELRDKIDREGNQVKPDLSIPGVPIEEFDPEREYKEGEVYKRLNPFGVFKIIKGEEIEITTNGDYAKYGSGETN
jgi:hypothetical protein